MGKGTRRRTAWLEPSAALQTGVTAVAAGVQFQQVLIPGADILDEEVTIARILGDYRLANTGVAPAVLFCGIKLQQAGLAVAAARGPQVFIGDEDWMWHRMYVINGPGNIGPGGGYGGYPGIDIRAKRKWSPDKDLVFLANCVVATEICVNVRVLVHLP